MNIYMSIPSILTIVFCVLIVGFVVGNYIYRKVKKLPTGECACCAKRKSNLLKNYYKCYPKK